MNVRRFVISTVATLMTLDMLVVASSLLPGPASVAAGEPRGCPPPAAVREADMLGCVWACIVCTYMVGRDRGACARCARCAGGGYRRAPLVRDAR